MMTLTQQNKKPSSSSPLNSMSGVSSRRVCAHRCHVDATCYAIGVHKVSPDQWACDFYGKLDVNEVFVTEVDYDMFEAQLYIRTVV